MSSSYQPMDPIDHIRRHRQRSPTLRGDHPSSVKSEEGSTLPVGLMATAPTVQAIIVLSPSVGTCAYAPNGRRMMGPNGINVPVTSVLGDIVRWIPSRGGIVLR